MATTDHTRPHGLFPIHIAIAFNVIVALHCKFSGYGATCTQAGQAVTTFIYMWQSYQFGELEQHLRSIDPVPVKRMTRQATTTWRSS